MEAVICAVIVQLQDVNYFINYDALDYHKYKNLKGFLIYIASLCSVIRIKLGHAAQTIVVVVVVTPVVILC